MSYIYVAGPLGADEANVTRACQAAFELIQAGHTPYVPHLTYYFEWHLVQRPGRVFWLTQDFAWLSLCDAVLRLPGESAGADAEVAFAVYLKVPVYYSVETLLEAQEALLEDEIEY